jgi:hypothetical protein
MKNALFGKSGPSVVTAGLVYARAGTPTIRAIVAAAIKSI